MNAQSFLSTERFDLWQPQAADLPDLCRLLEDEETRRFLGLVRAGEPQQFDRLLRSAGSWALYGYGLFAVRERRRPEIIASCGIFHSWRGFGAEARIDNVPEAGWIVRRDWWRQGVALEVMRAVLSWFDEAHGPTRITCMIEEGNVGSDRVARHLGFERYGTHDLADETPPVRVNLLHRQP
jgi:RimJ/RimL family protein N-acetyltransferase